MNSFLRRALLGLGGLVALVSLFYVEEDCRGWYVWHHFNSQCAAKGIKLDFNSIVPPRVADDQNFAFSPAWIAEINLLWRSTPQRLASWYGDRVKEEAVTDLASKLPVSVSALTGDNANPPGAPPLPVMSGNWATGRSMDLESWQAYYRKAARAVPSAGIRVGADGQSAAGEVLLVLSRFDPVLDRVRADAALPGARFPVVYTTDDPAEILLPHLAVLKRYAQVLQLRAVAELQVGESDKALADVQLMLRLNDAIRTEPFVISHLVRMVIVNMALQPIWEGAMDHRWSDAQLAELEADLARVNFLGDYGTAIRGETGFQSGIIEYLRRHPNQIDNLFGNGNGRRQRVSFYRWLGWRLMPRGWYYLNAVHCDRPMVDLLLPLADVKGRTVSPAAARMADMAIQKEIRHANIFNFVEKMVVPGSVSVIRRFAYAQESVDLARVSIALERFYLANGAYPSTLDPLAPRYMTELPNDIIGGEPLNYRLSPGSKYVLYSVGWNGTDDGGKVTTPKSGALDILTGDWVWQN